MERVHRCISQCGERAPLQRCQRRLGEHMRTLKYLPQAHTTQA
jgi:hypothetical protein